MRLRKPLASPTERFVLAALIALSVIFAGCASKSAQVVLYPIRDTDIYVLTNSDVCMSEFYLNKVLSVQLEKGR